MRNKIILIVAVLAVILIWAYIFSSGTDETSASFPQKPTWNEQVPDKANLLSEMNFYYTNSLQKNYSDESLVVGEKLLAQAITADEAATTANSIFKIRANADEHLLPKADQTSNRQKTIEVLEKLLAVADAPEKQPRKFDITFAEYYLGQLYFQEANRKDIDFEQRKKLFSKFEHWDRKSNRALTPLVDYYEKLFKEKMSGL